MRKVILRKQCGRVLSIIIISTSTETALLIWMQLFNMLSKNIAIYKLSIFWIIFLLKKFHENWWVKPSIKTFNQLIDKSFNCLKMDSETYVNSRVARIDSPTESKFPVWKINDKIALTYWKADDVEEEQPPDILDKCNYRAGFKCSEQSQALIGLSRLVKHKQRCQVPILQTAGTVCITSFQAILYSTGLDRDASLIQQRWEPGTGCYRTSIDFSISPQRWWLWVRTPKPMI